MIRTDQLCYAIGDFSLRRLSLEIGRGCYFVLLGPPGSGKSIFLECLCGLNRVDSGRIYMGGREVTALPPRERMVGYVPQDYALFPHLNVAENLSFGLRHQAMPRKEMERRVEETAAMLGISHLRSRRVPGLSGGERQRVALGRALAMRPQVLLLDEPVSALDESTRQEVCEHLLRLHRQLGLTTIHVSHNQEEAFSIADQAGLLEAGQLRQVGTMDRLLRRPVNAFVARFMRCENIFQAAATRNATGECQLQCQGVRLRLAGRAEGTVSWMIRPEEVHVFKPKGRLRSEDNELPVRLVRARDFGNYTRLTLDGVLSLVAHVPHGVFVELAAPPESSLAVRLPPEAIHLLGA